MSHEYAVPFAFTGAIERVVIDLSGSSEPDHEIAIRVAFQQD